MTSWMAKYDAIMKGEQNKIVLDSPHSRFPRSFCCIIRDEGKGALLYFLPSRYGDSSARIFSWDESGGGTPWKGEERTWDSWKWGGKAPRQKWLDE